MPNAVRFGIVVALVSGCTVGAPETAPTTTTPAVGEAEPRVVVHQRPGLDDVLVLGAPFGVEDRGTLVTVDLATGEVSREIHGGERWPAGFKEPTTDPQRPDAEAAARAPDGEAAAVFERAAETRSTGITIITPEGERFHRLQSVGGVVAGRLVWSPDSDAVYLIAAGAGGAADRVIGIPLRGSPQTVVRLDERGFIWLAVE